MYWQVSFLRICSTMNLVTAGALLKVTPEFPLQFVLKSSSKQAEEINRLSQYFFIAAGFILLVVVVLTFTFLYNYNEKRTAVTQRKTLSRKWEIAMIGVPSVLVVIFFILTLNTMQRVLPPVNNKTPDVVITGQQWWWQVAYPASGALAANEIHLPVKKDVLLLLRSADVVHDWWVPQFGNKMDMVPGRDNFIWLHINEPGTYYGTCSEFCGAQHAHMQIQVVAQLPAEFENWVQQQKKLQPNTLTVGAQLFLRKTCATCHRIGGTAANGMSAPDLTHIGSRKTLLAGMMRNTEANLARWISDPQKIKPGAKMPNFLLDSSEVHAIASYLYSLK